MSSLSSQKKQKKRTSSKRFPQRNSSGAASLSLSSSSSQRLNPWVFIFLVVVLLCYQCSRFLSAEKLLTMGETDESLNVPRIAETSTTTVAAPNSTDSPQNTKISATVAAPNSADPSVLDDQSLEEWRKRRVGKETFDSWFDKKGKFLEDNIDSSGPVLDFVIIGFPKCGTTAMMRTLGTVTTMPPEQDICTPAAQTVYYSYINWAKTYGNGAHNYTEEKPLKGSKCPYYIEGPDLDTYGKKLPKTNLIVGFRHPVLWFQSFINMVRVCVHEF